MKKTEINLFQDSVKANAIMHRPKFIDRELVVVNYYKDTLGFKEKICIGDVIKEINGCD